MRKALLALALVALAGCGGGSESGGSGSKPGPASIVDPNGNPPLVNSREVEPGTGKLLVTTNRGFFRVDPKGGDAERISGAAIAKGRSVPVGGFLEVLPTGPRTLLGSGHPDRKGVLPEFLGVLRSEDAGRTWTVIARLGEADLHRMVLKGGKLYAFDAGRRRQVGNISVSADGADSWKPVGRVQGEPARLKAVDAEHLYVVLKSGAILESVDGARSWKPL